MPSSEEQGAAARAIASLSSVELLTFLHAQRWFGAKGSGPANARIADFVVLPWGDGAFAIARLLVDVDGREQTYQLTIAAREAVPREIEARATIRPGVYDAVYDADFRAGLADALIREVVAESGNARWSTHPTTQIAPFAADAASKVGSAEQSNTSIVFGDRAILKLFRTLGTGVHPDVEVAEFLTTRAHFANTPQLLGTLRYAQGNDHLVVGMFQEFLPRSTDAWTYALEQGRAYFDAPVDRDPPNTFAADARRLGAVTRAMHGALADDDDDPAFSPDDVTPEDVDRWAHRAQQAIRDSLTLLSAQLATNAVPNDRVAEATALVGRREHFLGWINEIDDSIGDDLGMRTRVHGDYHLGQVLRTATNDFMVIDFEGEPSKSLAERREKTSPLRDVAGMLRSFAYAAATLALSAKNIDPRTRELRTARWERDVRNAYLEGYLAPRDEDAPDMLPEDETHAHQLIALFEAEKAFYELAYELNNRPTWAWIPMRGISKLFVASSSR